MMKRNRKRWHEYPFKRSSGFSLVELLAVMALIGLTYSFVVPIASNLLRGQPITRAVNGLSSLLEYARQEAMTRQTYTWVCFGERTNALGNIELSVVVLASRDGTSNVAASNLRQMSRGFVFENVVLSETASLRPTTRALTTGLNPDGAVVQNNSGVDFNTSGVTYDRSMTFTPSGAPLFEASPTWASGFARIIDISLRHSRGGNAPEAEADDAAIYLHGASGRIHVVRL